MDENYQKQENYSQPNNSSETVHKSFKKIILISIIAVCLFSTVVIICFFPENDKKVQNNTQNNQSPTVILVKGLLTKSIIPSEVNNSSQLPLVKLDNYPGNVVGSKQLYFSPDFKHVAYVAENGQNTDIYLDGILVPIENNNGFNYEVDKFTFSPNNKHLAFTVIWKMGKNMFGNNNSEYTIYVDGVPSKKYKYVSEFVFSPDGDSYAYRALDSGGDFVVLNGKEQSKYNYVHNIFFSPDGKRIVYMVDSGNERNYFVVDGIKENFVVSSVLDKSFTFSNDSKHYAYISYKDSNGNNYLNHQIIFDGKFLKDIPGDNYSVDRLQISPDNEKISYLVDKESGGMYTVVDGKELPNGMEPVVYSSDGKHFAYKAILKKDIPKNSGPVKQTIIKDGEILGSFDVLGDLSFNQKGDLLYDTRSCPGNGIDGAFISKSRVTSNGELVCSVQKGGTASGHFSYTLTWGDKVVETEINSQVKDIFINPSNKNMVYVVQDILNSNKYYAVSNGTKSGYYDKLYGPVFISDSQVIFFADQKGQLQPILLDNSGEVKFMNK